MSDRIKFYSNADMSSYSNFNMALEKIENLQNKENSINDILEYYNILKFFNKEFLKYQDENVVKKCLSHEKELKSFIGTFCSNITNENILNLLHNTDINYVDDFFEIIEKYNIYKKINDDIIEQILNTKEIYLYHILKNKQLVTYFQNAVRKYMIIDNNNAELLLDEYEVEHIGNHENLFFSDSLSYDDKEQILINYINSINSNLNYLRLIENLQSNSNIRISDKTKLLAKKKVEEQEKNFFSGNNGIEMSTLVQVKKGLKNTYDLKIDGQNIEFTYDLNWIEENINDNSTLMNNFIYLFEFVDGQCRCTFVSKKSYMGLFEKNIFMRSKNDYPVSVTFNRLNQLADLQLCSYYAQLQKYGVRIENLISWFFDTYVLNEFNIKNYKINVPTENSNYLEKCRCILPEIDSCLKQYNYYVDDKEIDPELVHISSTHLFFKNVKSLIKNKYVYPKNNEYELITFYLFSDQCMLSYIEGKNHKYHTFYELLKHENIKEEEIVEYEKKSLRKLINDGYLYIDTSGFIKIKDEIKVNILYDLYLNDVISYWKLNEAQRNKIDELLSAGMIEFESSLFTKQEQDYLNYCLNKSKFSNSLDLRNMYGHGTQKSGNENIHYSNYIRFLKIFIFIIIKINDELCIFDEINKKNNDCMV